MSRPAFLGLAALASALAAVLVLELGSTAPTEDVGGAVPVRHAPRAQPRAAVEDPVDHTDAWVQTSLARPLFSRDRRPTPAVAKSGETVIAALPRLTGVLVGPFGRRALFAGSDGGKPSVVEEGGSLGPYTVQSIGPGHVTVVGPEGPHELVPAYDAAARQAMAAEVPQPPLPPAPVVPTRGQMLNLRAGSQFQRALSAIENAPPAPQGINRSE
jgi:hypothetical protein